MSEVWQLDVLESARKFSDGEASGRHVPGAHFSRVDAVDPHLNAIVRAADITTPLDLVLA
jgi:hypothetical protein